MEWRYIVFLISGLFVVLLILKEVSRKDRRNLASRLIASIIAIFSLVFIALPPSYTKSKKHTKGRDVVLLTDGFSKDTLSVFNDPIVLTSDERIFKKAGSSRALLIPSVDYYLNGNRTISTLHILGYGLPKDELEMLPNIGIKFHQAERPFGFQKTSWQQKLKAGEDLNVAGTFNNNSGKEIKILLKGLGTTLDSAIVKADTLLNFRLNCTPRQTGLAINSLVVISGNDTLAKEQVPFEVQKAESLSVLMLSASPDFEINFLKNWLESGNFSVAIRSSISTGKFSTEFLNMDAKPINLQSSTLRQFDLLITDETSLVKLSQSELLAIKAQVNAGMGLLIRNEEEIKMPKVISGSFNTLPMEKEEILHIALPDRSYQLLIPNKGSGYISPQPFDQPLLHDSKGRILANSITTGLGRVVFSTLNNTYIWKLSGKPADYSSYWAYLIEKASKKKPAKMNLRIAEHFPVAHRKNTLMLQVRSAELPQLFSNGIRIAMAGNAALPGQWQGAFWPGRQGWNFAELKNEDKSAWYVYGENDWESVRKVQNSLATNNFTRRQSALQNFDSRTTQVNVKIPAIIFYLLFVLCCTWLWIETKFL